MSDRARWSAVSTQRAQPASEFPCPLRAETDKLIDADALAGMKPSAYLLNAAC
jgi:hypothetical protein